MNRAPVYSEHKTGKHKNSFRNVQFCMFLSLFIICYLNLLIISILISVLKSQYMKSVNLDEQSTCLFRTQKLVPQRFFFKQVSLYKHSHICIISYKIYSINLANQNTVRQANVVTSIKQSPVLKGHLY
jgi:hypothetical protein